MLVTGYVVASIALFGMSSASHPSPYHFSNPLCTTDIHVRYPPVIQNSTDWVPPPYAWFYGNWKVRYSTQSSYQLLYNFQADHYPRLPSSPAIANLRQNVDLTSFQLAITGNATIDDAIFTAFGYDTPQPSIGTGVYSFQGTGYLSTTQNDWMFLAWGYDTDGIAWRLEYETPATSQNGGGGEANINLSSRTETGPSNVTYQAIIKQLRATFANDPTLGLYVANLTELVIDGRRTGLSPVACDEACLNNTNLAG